MNKKLNKLLIVLILAFLSFSISKAQFGSFGTIDAQSAAIGNSFGASESVTAIGKNPAFLVCPADSNSKVVFQIPNAMGKALNSSMSFDDFNKYFNNPRSLNLSDKEKDNFFNAIKGDPSLIYDFGATAFAISWTPSPKIGTFAFSTTDYSAGNMTMPREFVDLALYGNKPNTTYSFSNMDFRFWYIRTYSLSYGRILKQWDDEDSFIKNISGGLTLKLANGYAYSSLEEIDANLSTGENNVITGNINYLAKTSFSPDFGVKYEFDEDTPEGNAGYSMTPGGTGFGMDIGFAAKLKHGFQVGLAVTDIGSIAWNERIAEYAGAGDIYADDLFDENQREDLENAFNDSSYAGGSFSTSLPTALRLSILYELTNSVEAIPGKLHLAFEYDQGFNDMPGNSTMPRIGFGAIWKTLPYVPVIGTGFTNSRDGSLRWTFGLGFSTSVIDIMFATQDLTTLMGGGSSPYISAAANFVWKINY